MSSIALTCDDVKRAGIFSPLIYTGSQLASMTKPEMDNCLSLLGFTEGFTAEQLKAIADKVVTSEVGIADMLT